jgi:hypothetical protein
MFLIKQFMLVITQTVLKLSQNYFQVVFNLIVNLILFQIWNCTVNFSEILKFCNINYIIVY